MVGSLITLLCWMMSIVHLELYWMRLMPKGSLYEGGILI